MCLTSTLTGFEQPFLTIALSSFTLANSLVNSSKPLLSHAQNPHKSYPTLLSLHVHILSKLAKINHVEREDKEDKEGFSILNEYYVSLATPHYQ